MNSRILALGLITLISATIAFAQDIKTQRKELSDQVSTLYQKGELEKAAAAAEKLVELEKTETNSPAYVVAVINLARIKKDYYISLLNNLSGNNKPDQAERREIVEKANLNGDASEQLFREALDLNEKTNHEQTAQTADLKRDLAWITYKHFGSAAKTVEKSRARIDEAEKLFLDSLALDEKLRGRDADETLFVARDLGDFYLNYVNFEKALPYYERFIQTYAQKHGDNNPDLVRALKPYARILYATSQDQEGEAVIKRIETITKKSESVPKADIDLYLRSKDAVAFTSPIITGVNQKAEAFRAKMKAEGKTLDRYNLSEMPHIVFVPVKVEIDESGKITKAEAVYANDMGKQEAEEAVSKWTVRPFSYNGTTRKMRGILVYRKAS